MGSTPVGYSVFSLSHSNDIMDITCLFIYRVQNLLSLFSPQYLVFEHMTSEYSI